VSLTNDTINEASFMVMLLDGVDQIEPITNRFFMQQDSSGDGPIPGGLNVTRWPTLTTSLASGPAYSRRNSLLIGFIGYQSTGGQWNVPSGNGWTEEHEEAVTDHRVMCAYRTGDGKATAETWTNDSSLNSNGCILLVGVNSYRGIRCSSFAGPNNYWHRFSGTSKPLNNHWIIKNFRDAGRDTPPNRRRFW
jgi:hypothetical protein